MYNISGIQKGANENMADRDESLLLKNLNIPIETAAYLDVGKEWKNMVEAFSFARIYYVRSGSGKLFLTNKTIELEEGYMYFIPSFSVLGGTCNSLGHYFIHFIPDEISARILKILQIKDRTKMDKSVADYLFTFISINCKNGTLKSTFALDSALKFLISQLLDDNTVLSAKEFDMQRFIPVLSYIDENLTGPIPLKTLVDLMYLDDVYFSNIFKVTFGISVKQYIMNKKIERAKTMLLSDTPVRVVAESLNFYDASSFSNYFKKNTGLTPREFKIKVIYNT